MQCAKNLKTDYGAVGNGVADDTTALNNAGASGEAVFVPPGTYLFNSAGFGLSNNTKFVGAGAGSSVLRATAATGSVSLGEPAPETRTNVGLYSLEVIAGTTRTQPLVRSSNCYNMQIFNCTFAAPGSTAIEINGGPHQFKAHIDRILITSADKGIVLGGDPTKGIVQDVWINDALIGSCASIGIELTNVSGVYMDGIDVISCGYGVGFRPSSGYENKAVFMTHVLADTCVYTGFWFAPMAGGKVNNVVMNGCWAATSSGAASPGVTIYTEAASALISNITIDSTMAVNNKGLGFLIGGEGVKNITLSNCEATSNGQGAANTYDGLFIRADVSNVTINGGIYGGDDSFPQNQRYGIYNESTSTRIRDVNVSNNMTSGIMDTSGNPF